MKTNELIKMRRLELNMTMKELAQKIGVSEGTISRWESGDIENMKRDKIAALARALEVPPAVLMDWEEYAAAHSKIKWNF
jgi:transcriptional regulator with XRE-family HTH domain